MLSLLSFFLDSRDVLIGWWRGVARVCITWCNIFTHLDELHLVLDYTETITISYAQPKCCGIKRVGIAPIKFIYFNKWQYRPPSKWITNKIPMANLMTFILVWALIRGDGSWFRGITRVCITSCGIPAHHSPQVSHPHSCTCPGCIWSVPCMYRGCTYAMNLRNHLPFFSVHFQ